MTDKELKDGVPGNKSKSSKKKRIRRIIKEKSELVQTIKKLKEEG